ncbi:hypothetical protein ElyMa_006807400 [Elysia marginata]|uniref:Uncharacterized protein n=1 Tax=Elysia marginata TaxID=1093978 RepID=A0AAV4J5T0_9GAST|nr:hypothetical protein ElyMa_006807400 [Elysia marginata]
MITSNTSRGGMVVQSRLSDQKVQVPNPSLAVRQLVLEEKLSYTSPRRTQTGQCGREGGVVVVVAIVVAVVVVVVAVVVVVVVVVVLVTTVAT